MSISALSLAGAITSRLFVFGSLGVGGVGVGGAGVGLGVAGVVDEDPPPPQPVGSVSSDNNIKEETVGMGVNLISRPFLFILHPFEFLTEHQMVALRFEVIKL